MSDNEGKRRGFLALSEKAESGDSMEIAVPERYGGSERKQSKKAKKHTVYRGRERASEPREPEQTFDDIFDFGGDDDDDGDDVMDAEFTYQAKSKPRGSNPRSYPKSGRDQRESNKSKDEMLVSFSDKLGRLGSGMKKAGGIAGSGMKKAGGALYRSAKTGVRGARKAMDQYGEWVEETGTKNRQRNIRQTKERAEYESKLAPMRENLLASRERRFETMDRVRDLEIEKKTNEYVQQIAEERSRLEYEAARRELELERREKEMEFQEQLAQQQGRAQSLAIAQSGQSSQQGRSGQLPMLPTSQQTPRPYDINMWISGSSQASMQNNNSMPRPIQRPMLTAQQPVQRPYDINMWINGSTRQSASNNVTMQPRPQNPSDIMGMWIYGRRPTQPVAQYVPQQAIPQAAPQTPQYAPRPPPISLADANVIDAEFVVTPAVKIQKAPPKPHRSPPTRKNTRSAAQGARTLPKGSMVKHGGDNSSVSKGAPLRPPVSKSSPPKVVGSKRPKSSSSKKTRK